MFSISRLWRVGERKSVEICEIRVNFSQSVYLTEFFISHRFHRFHRFNSSDSGGIILVYLNRYGNVFDLSSGLGRG
jgi:hypothetical protein